MLKGPMRTASERSRLYHDPAGWSHPLIPHEYRDDAVSYLTSDEDVRAMAATATYHCQPRGAVVVIH